MNLGLKTMDIVRYRSLETWNLPKLDACFAVIQEQRDLQECLR